MKHLKRTVSLCLTLLMILGCLPNLSLTASAANYGVWVLGTRVTDANKGDVLGDGTVRTAKLGVIAGVSNRQEGSTRCIPSIPTPLAAMNSATMSAT